MSQAKTRVSVSTVPIAGDPDTAPRAHGCGHSGYEHGSYLRLVDVATGSPVCPYCLPRQIRDGAAVLVEPERIAEEVAAWPRDPKPITAADLHPILAAGCSDSYVESLGAYFQPPGRAVVMAMKAALAAHQMGPIVPPDDLAELERALVADPESRSRLAQLLNLKGSK